MSEKSQLQLLEEYRELVGYILEESGRSSIPHLQCIPENSLGIRFSSETDIVTRRVSLRFEYKFNGRQGLILREVDELSLRRDCFNIDALELIRSAVDEIAARIAGEICGEVVKQILGSEGRNSTLGLALQKSLVSNNV